MYSTYFIQVVFIKSIAKREEKEGVVFSSYGVTTGDKLRHWTLSYNENEIFPFLSLVTFTWMDFNFVKFS